ncbi:TnsD family Tn7-like transposition protein [Aquipseudomonas alcaligenes]|uniref:TnsD family transposase n=1 Tax=Aquipseudomonas alcaligenes TaxID=43263 RepID=A0AB73HYB0_AQUAC|nr:TnsD family Tn7-like transposition protein [Pseudomonas alcaligenes]MDH0142807.1 TnsD family transposase [Pseudomonas alcaligenes]
MSALSLGELEPATSIFLKWLADETFFSICSRHHAFWGNSKSNTTFSMLFDSCGTTIPHDFPRCLELLRPDFQIALGDPESIIHRHTILPLFFPFQSPQCVQAAIESAKGPHLGGIKYRLGLVAGRFGAQHPLKACRLCMSKDKDSQGVAYWHLSHQYPGVLVCPTHMLRLQECVHNRRWSGRHRWVLPENANLTPPSDEQLDLPALQALHNLAMAALDLAAVGASRAFEPAVVRSVYQKAIIGRGFSSRHLSAAAADLTQHTSLLQPFYPLTALPTTVENTAAFLEQFVRRPRGHLHPIKHLVMINWLFGKFSNFIEAYNLEPTTTKLSLIKSNPQVELVNPLPQLKTPQTCKLKPKFLKPPIRAEILHLLKNGTSKEQIYSQFNITPSTVNKLLRSEPNIKHAWEQATKSFKKLSMRKQWSSLLKDNSKISPKAARAIDPKLYAWLYRNDKAWLLQENTKLHSGRNGNNCHVDWAERDSELIQLITNFRCLYIQNRSANRNILEDLFTKIPSLSICLKKPNRYFRTKALIREIRKSSGGHGV